jgi:hypothetical protein
MPVIVGLLVCVPTPAAVAGLLGNSAARRRTRFPALGHWLYDPGLRPPGTTHQRQYQYQH